MLHFLLLPLLLSAWYERPGSPARASHALCVSKRIIIARAITFHVPSFWAAVWLYLPVPATRRPRTLLPRVQSSIRDHICCFASRLLCKPGEPELYTRPSLPCFTKMPLCHWSSDSASTNITDVQSQILNAPPLVKVLQLLSKLLNVPNPHRLQSLPHSTQPSAALIPFLQSLPCKRAFPLHIVCLVHGHSFITDPLRCPACVCRLCVIANELLAGGYAVTSRLQQNSF